MKLEDLAVGKRFFIIKDRNPQIRVIWTISHVAYSSTQDSPISLYLRAFNSDYDYDYDYDYDVAETFTDPDLSTWMEYKPVYVTSYYDKKGIIETYALGGYIEYAINVHWPDGFNNVTNFVLGEGAFLTKEEAEADVEDRIAKRFASLEKQLCNLEKLQVEYTKVDQWKF